MFAAPYPPAKTGLDLVLTSQIIWALTLLECCLGKKSRLDSTVKGVKGLVFDGRDIIGLNEEVS